MSFDSSIKSTVNYYEKLYADEVNDVAQTIVQQKIRLCFLAGPSCSGKTTTSKRIRDALAKYGIGMHVISIDDFYKDHNDSIFGNGKTDYESPLAIDTDYMHDCIDRLLVGLGADIPIFDFTKKRRVGYERMDIRENDVVIAEGLHALNPLVFRRHEKCGNILKIFLDAETPRGVSGNVRFMRRLVRDHYFRAQTVRGAFSIWESVKKGERKYIYPYAKNADIAINTYYGCELGVLRPHAEKILLSEIDSAGEYTVYVNRILSVLKKHPPIDESYIPDGSLLWEFIPKPEEK